MPRKKKGKSNPPKRYSHSQAIEKAQTKQAERAELQYEILQKMSDLTNRAYGKIESNPQQFINYYKEWLIYYNQLKSINKDESITSILPYVCLMLGQAYEKRNQEGDLDNAIEYFSKSYQYCPFNLDNKLRLGMAQMKKQKYDIAIIIFYEIINHTPNEKLEHEKIEHTVLSIDQIVTEATIDYAAIHLHKAHTINSTYHIPSNRLEKLLKQAAKQNDEAYYYLGILENDYKGARARSACYMQIFLDKYDKSSASTRKKDIVINAHTQLGFAAIMESNFDTAIAHFTIGANLQNATSQYNLAIALDHDENPKRDPIVAIKHYLDAANQGHPYACNNLGFKYLNAEDVELNSELGLKYTLFAAENGIIEAMNRLGDAYCEGLLIAQNLDEAINWYNKAINHGNTNSYCALAATYMRKAVQLENKKGNPKTVATYNNTALRHLLKLEGNTNDQAVYANLGTLYAGSTGISIDFDKATKYLIDSYLKGHEILACNIFCLYNDIKISDAAKYSSLLTKIETFFEAQFNERNLITGYYHIIIILQNRLSFSEEVKHARAKARTLHIQTNNSIRYTASNKSEAAIEKLKKLIVLAKKKIFNPANYSTFIYFVGLIFVNVGTDRVKLYTFWPDISAIIDDATNNLVDLGENDLRKLIVGLSHLYRHVKDENFYISLYKFYNYTIEHCHKLKTQDICKILLASTRFDLTDQNLKTNLENLSSIVLRRKETLETNDIANLIYSMAIFDCHYRKNRKAYSISINDIKPIITLAVSCSNGNNLSKAIQHQIYSGLLYFSTKYHEIKSEIETFKVTMEDLHLLIKKEEKDTNISRLQKRIANCLKKNYPDLIEEKLINGLPVDIYIPSLNLIIQVDGPTHFLEYEGHYSMVAKTLFHDTILQLLSPGNTQDAHKKPHVLHLPYFKLNLIPPDRLTKHLHEKINGLNLVPKIKAASAMFSSPQKLTQDTAIAGPSYIAPSC